MKTIGDFKKFKQKTWTKQSMIKKKKGHHQTKKMGVKWDGMIKKWKRNTQKIKNKIKNFKHNKEKFQAGWGQDKERKKSIYTDK